MSDILFDSVTKCAILPSIFGSDHSPIMIKIECSRSQKKGRGYWKINNTFLDEPDYIELINYHRVSWIEEIESLADPRLKWEYLKYKIRQVSITYKRKRA